MMPMPILVKMCKGLTVKGGGTRVSRLIERIGMTKIDSHLLQFEKYIRGKVLDVGLGTGINAKYLISKGFSVTGVDVVNYSMYEDIKPIIYDGKKLPFADNSFDTALIMLVLHHCGEDNVKILKEAKRVAKRVIFLEDTYRNSLERLFVSLHDQIGNLEFYEHNYLKMKEWDEIIKANKWKVLYRDTYSKVTYGVGYGRYAAFVIE